MNSIKVNSPLWSDLMVNEKMIEVVIVIIEPMETAASKCNSFFEKNSFLIELAPSKTRLINARTKTKKVKKFFSLIIKEINHVQPEIPIINQRIGLSLDFISHLPFLWFENIFIYEIHEAV